MVVSSVHSERFKQLYVINPDSEQKCMNCFWITNKSEGITICLKLFHKQEKKGQINYSCQIIHSTLHQTLYKSQTLQDKNSSKTNLYNTFKEEVIVIIKHFFSTVTLHGSLQNIDKIWPQQQILNQIQTSELPHKLRVFGFGVPIIYMQNVDLALGSDHEPSPAFSPLPPAKVCVCFRTVV